MKNILKILEDGKLLLSPTDTIWGILCDATNVYAVDKVYQLKKRSDSKAMICMVSDLEMLKKYIPKLPVNIKKYIYCDRPTTVILSNPIAIASNAIAKEKTVAIRIVNHHFCTPLISAFGKPVVMATPKSMLIFLRKSSVVSTISLNKTLIRSMIRPQE